MECVKAQFLSSAPIPEGQLLVVKLQILPVAIGVVSGNKYHFMCQSLKLMISCDSAGLAERRGASYSKLSPQPPVSKDITAGTHTTGKNTDGYFHRKHIKGAISCDLTWEIFFLPSKGNIYLTCFTQRQVFSR